MGDEELDVLVTKDILLEKNLLLAGHCDKSLILTTVSQNLIIIEISKNVVKLTKVTTRTC